MLREGTQPPCTESTCTREMGNFHLFPCPVHGKPIRRARKSEPPGATCWQRKKPTASYCISGVPLVNLAAEAVRIRYLKISEEELLKMENDELLIDLVKNYSVLYDRSKKEFRDTALKDRVWASIGEVLKTSGQDCSSRWGTLRDRFVRELKADSSILPSGSGALARRGWPLKEAMMWLQPFIRARKTFGNCREPINSPLLTLSASPELPPSPKPSLPLPSPTSVELTESSSSSSASLTIPVSTPSPDTIFIGSPSPERKPQSCSPSPDSFSFRKRKQGADLESALISSLAGFSRHLSDKKMKKDEDDENELFCRSLLSNLRRLSHRRQNEAKRKLLEVMFTFEDE